MTLIAGYMSRRVLTLFPAGLVVLTAIIWSTQALQRLDLVTAKGQTFATFFALTAAAVPYLATLLAPIAFVIAMIAVYDTMNRDSELVVIGASGAGRLRLLEPALISAAVCAALVAVGVVWAGPAGLAAARVMLTEVRADVVTSIVQPGRFIELEPGLTVAIRDRSAGGALTGLLLDDRRRPELTMTYLAETAHVVEAEDNTLLVMTNGSVERMARPAGDLSVVAFDAYAFDLTELTAGAAAAKIALRPSERTLTDLLSPASDDAYRAQHEGAFQAEVADRLSQPLAPFVYALVVFLFVGDPRMHRRGRLAGIVAAGVSVAAVRGATYATLLAAEATPSLGALVFVINLGVAGLALWLIATDRTVSFHERWGGALAATLARLFARRVVA